MLQQSRLIGRQTNETKHGITMHAILPCTFHGPNAPNPKALGRSPQQAIAKPWNTISLPSSSWHLRPVPTSTSTCTPQETQPQLHLHFSAVSPQSRYSRCLAELGGVASLPQALSIPQPLVKADGAAKNEVRMPSTSIPRPRHGPGPLECVLVYAF